LADYKGLTKPSQFPLKRGFKKAFPERKAFKVPELFFGKLKAAPKNLERGRTREVTGKEGLGLRERVFLKGRGGQILCPIPGVCPFPLTFLNSRKGVRGSKSCAEVPSCGWYSWS